jgi:hypothetical protein
MPTRSLPDLCVGWQAVDPGPGPLSPLYDDPPAGGPGTDLVAEHAAWRRAVEADQHRLEQQHLASMPVWYPVPTLGRHPVVPVVGGSAASWDHLVTGLVVAANDAGFDRIRIANLVQWPILGSLEQVGRSARSLSIRFEQVSSEGSTIDLFGRSGPDLASLIVDALRVDPHGTGRRDAARDKQELLQVLGLLDGPVSLGRAAEALSVALGANPAASSALAPSEVRALRDHRATVVALQREVAARLSNLLADVRELALYQRDPSISPRVLGSGPDRVRTLEVGGSGSVERELARELIARSLARAFASPTTTNDLLVIAGAEHLAPDVLTDLAASAQRHGKQLVLMYAEGGDDLARMLGHAGSGFAIFLKLANRSLAEAAAEFLGREYTFVVNGISIAEGQTEEWNESLATTSTSSTTRGRSSTSTSGSAGLALSMGRSFGTNVSRSFSTGSTTTQGAGRSASSTTTTSRGRVHEYVIEPEVFQRLDEDVMLVVDDDAVTLASCDYRIHKAPSRSAVPYRAP